MSMEKYHRYLHFLAMMYPCRLIPCFYVDIPNHTYFLGSNQNITTIPTLKFFKSGDNSSVQFDIGPMVPNSGIVDQLIVDLFAFIDREMGRVSIKV